MEPLDTLARVYAEENWMLVVTATDVWPNVAEKPSHH